MSEVTYTDPITQAITVRDKILDIAITSEWGRNVDVVHRLLKEHRAGKSAMLSELDIRRLAIKNPGASDLLNNYWDTPNLSARRGEIETADSQSRVRNVLKVLLPYSNNSYELTEAVSYGLGLINPTETLVDAGVSLDEVRWNKLEGPGVHSGEIEEWFEKRANGSLIGFNEEMTRDQALRNPFLLTRLQHPDYVAPEFAISADEVAEIIGTTFDLGQERHGYTRMMGQYFDDPDMPKVHEFPKIGVLKPMCVRSLVDKMAGMKLYGELDIADGRFSRIALR
jgi:hypothetical protein